MLSAWGIRKFLLKQPRAELIRLTVRGEVQEIKPTRGQSLAKIGESIFAVSPEVIELFDGNGRLLRAIRPENETETNTDQPKPPEILKADPETARLTHFASLLAKAYEHTTNVAFAKLVELVERIDARTDAVESRLERTEALYRRELINQAEMARDEAERIVDEAQGVEGEDREDLLRQMMSAFMQGRSERRRAPKPNGAGTPSNGKGD